MLLTLLKQHRFAFFSLTILLVISFLFSETSYSYVDKWNKFDESLGHGFLILALVLFEIFKLSKSFSPIKESKKHILLLVIVILVIAHEISYFWGILVFQQFSIYFLWLTLIAYILGLKYFKLILFPLAFFLFAVPFWEFSNSFFVELTTSAVTFFLSFTDLAVFIHENFIETPYGIIEIAEGCSGIRYFEIGFAIAVYATHEEPISRQLKLLVILSGIVLGIITNWIRVLGLIYIGYSTKLTSPLMKEHDNYGFLLFFIVISGVIILLNLLRKKYAIQPDMNEQSIPYSSSVNLSLNELFLRGIIANSLLLITFFIINGKLNSLTNNIASNQHKGKYPTSVLNNYGIFTEKTKDYQLNTQNCKLISRSYDFIKPGENTLPYGKVLNQKDYILRNSYVKRIKFVDHEIEVNYAELTNQRTTTTLYYWYEYKGIQTANYYLAKLLELSYLLQSQSKMKLNAIWCNPTVKK